MTFKAWFVHFLIILVDRHAKDTGLIRWIVQRWQCLSIGTDRNASIETMAVDRIHRRIRFSAIRQQSTKHQDEWFYRWSGWSRSVRGDHFYLVYGWDNVPNALLVWSPRLSIRIRPSDDSSVSTRRDFGRQWHADIDIDHLHLIERGKKPRLGSRSLRSLTRGRISRQGFVGHVRGGKSRTMKRNR